MRVRVAGFCRTVSYIKKQIVAQDIIQRAGQVWCWCNAVNFSTWKHFFWNHTHLNSLQLFLCLRLPSRNTPKSLKFVSCLYYFLPTAVVQPIFPFLALLVLATFPTVYSTVFLPLYFNTQFVSSCLELPFLFSKVHCAWYCSVRANCVQSRSCKSIALDVKALDVKPVILP